MIKFPLIQAGRRRRTALAAVLAIGLGVGVNETARGAVTTIGAVTPVPPVGGGAVVGAFTIGDGAYGSVSVTGSTGLTGSGGTVLGNGVGGIGYFSLSGYGSNLEVSTAGLDLIIGDEGVGSVNLSNQAKIIIPDDTNLGVQSTATGRLVVTGLGTTYLNGDDMTVGLNGTGSVEILDGGSIDAGTVNIGDNAAANGSALVSGDLSHWHADGVAVGDAGTGRLELADEGRLTASTSVQVAIQAGSYGVLVVDGIGSRLQSAEHLSTGLGDAFITLSNGGTVTTVAPSQISATGRVTLAGGRWTSNAVSPSAITVAGLLEGSGTLDVQGVAVGGGSPVGRLQTKTGDHLLLTGQLANSGLVDLAGGEFEVRGIVSNNGDIDARNGATLRAGGTGLDNNSGSQLAITSGAVDVFGAVDNNAGAEIAVVGGATGVFHDTVVNNGKIHVSASSGMVMLEDLSFLSSASLGVQLGDLKAGEGSANGFEYLSVAGSSTLAGTLAVSLAPEYTPTLGDTFTILTAANGISGTFATGSLPAIGGGFSLEVHYTSTSVLLAVGPSQDADYNNDGFVDATDLSIWRNAFGTTPEGDADGDNDSDGADFLLWQQQFGSAPAIAAAQPAAGAVPEPSGAALVLIAAGLIARRRTRRSA